MGLFRRRKKPVDIVVRVDRQEAPAQRPAPPERGVPDLPLMRLGAGGRVNAVGESNYQQALSAVCGGRERHGDVDLHQAVLVPEPDNPYDSQAVRVAVEGRTVGYLAREDAAMYQPVLLDLQRAGFLGWCPAAIVGGGDRSYGVFMRLADPSTLWPVNSAGSLRVLEADRNVAVTKRKPHEAALSLLLGSRDAVLMFGELVPSTVASGKYVGAPCLEVRIDGHRIGEFSAAMTNRYAGQVDGHCCCEVVISRHDRGIQAEALMPIVAR